MDKKLLTLSALSASVLISCSLYEHDIPTPDSSPLDALISKVESSRTSYFQTKGSEIKVDRNEIYYITSPNERNKVQDTILYVLNFTNDQGFAIVPYGIPDADIICVTTKGQYNGKTTGVSGFDEYVREITQQLIASRNVDTIQINRDSSSGSDYTTTTVNPIIPVSWQQYAPFNWYCSSPYNSSIPCGCIALSIAQALSSFSYPEDVYLSYTPYVSSPLELNWEDMLSHNSSVCTYGQCDICNMKAFLLREIGQRTNMSYNTWGSFTGINSIKPCLLSLGTYCNDPCSFYPQPITNSLDLGRPVIVCSIYENTNTGHAWNIDGYQYTKTTHYQYDISGLLTGTSKTETWYMYFKYGDNGNYDGLYLCYQQITGTGSYTINGSTSVYTPIHVFSEPGIPNYNVQIITDIRPF